MSSDKTLAKTSLLSSLAGFLLLFLVYHLPEVLQQHYQQPLLGLMEAGMAFFVGLYFFITSRQHPQPLYASGLSDFKRHQKNLYIGLSIGMLLTIALNLLTVMLHWNSIQLDLPFGELLLKTIIFAAGTFLPSLAEDLLTRSYLRTHWPARYAPGLLILTSSAVYTLNHIFRLSHPDVLFYLFVLGILLMMSFVLTRSLWLTLGIHWGSNIAYQFFANIATVHTLKSTGYENYLLAGCFAIGSCIVLILHRLGIFSIAPKEA